ncbi:MAG: mechanosensitive ion channel domain-containing protein [Bdellovibrionota bacterium]|jgi:potassium efflux system protein
MKRLQLLFCFVFLFPSLLLAQGLEEGVVATPTVEPQVVSNASELAPKLSELTDEFNALTTELLTYKTFLTESQDKFLKHKEHFKALVDLYQETSNLKYINIDRISEINAKLKDLSVRSEQQIEEFTTIITKLATTRDKWQENGENWQRWKMEFKADYSVVKQTFDTVDKQVTEAISEITKIEKPLLQKQSELVAFQSKIKDLLKKIAVFLSTYKKDILTKTGASFFSFDFWKNFNSELWQESTDAFVLLVPLKDSITSKHTLMFVLHLFLILLIFLTLKYLQNKRLKTERANLGKLFSVPISTSVFVSTILVGPYYGLDLPPLFKIVLLIAASICGARLVTAFMQVKERKVFIDILVVTFVISQLCVIINIPEPLVRVYIALISLFILTVLVARLRVLAKEGGAFWGMAFISLMIVLMIATLTSEAFGYTQLASKIFDSSVRSIFSCVLAWLLGVLIKEGLFVFLSYSIFAHVMICRKYSKHILSKFNLWIDVFISFMAIAVILLGWKLFDSLEETVSYLLNLAVTISGVQFSVGRVLFAVFLFDMIIFGSWFLRKTLNEEVYPKKNVQIGVRVSINRIIQYSCICLGVVLGLSILGFNLKNLAVAFGVLGVGIGFGLQNIVNNFASGVILLFERPIKVGDVVEVGGYKGEVKKIGLRATIVETYEKAEVIVPNSDIASSKVVNWTLSTRKVRTVINVGVSYDSDVEEVSRLLCEIAQKQPAVATDPEPAAFFISFGEGSLNFELRFWSSIDDAFGLRNIINREITKTFKEAKIEIPFPKRDVNIAGLQEFLNKK